MTVEGHKLATSLVTASEAELTRDKETALYRLRLHLPAYKNSIQFRRSQSVCLVAVTVDVVVYSKR